MPALDRLLAQVDSSADELLALHRALVRIESVNTGFMRRATRPKSASS